MRQLLASLCGLRAGRLCEFAGMFFVVLALQGCGSTPALVAYDQTIQAEYELSEEEEYLQRVSADLTRDIEEGGLIVREPQVQAMVEAVVARLLPQSEVRASISVEVIRAPEINAFATGNRRIYIHSGIFSALETEDQFAALLSHEIAHIAEQHVLQAVLHRKRTVSNAKIANYFTLGLATFVALDSLSNYSQAHESAADAFSVSMLAEAQYSPRATLELLANIRKMSGRLDEGSQFWRSHPTSEERIAALESKVENQPPRGGELAEPSTDFQAVRMYLIEENLSIRIRNRQYRLALNDLDLLESLTTSIPATRLAFYRGEALLGMAKNPESAARELAIIEVGDVLKWRDYANQFEADAPRNLSEASTQFTNAFNLDASQLTALLRLGETEQLLGNADAAVERYSQYKALAVDPRDQQYADRLIERVLRSSQTTH